MKCFAHHEADALGVCSACGRGVCEACAVDMGRGLACRERCEPEVRRLLDLRDYWMTEPHTAISRSRHIRRQSIYASLICLGFAAPLLVTWIMFSEPILGGIGALMLIIGLATLVPRKHRIADAQFRLCPNCGFNLTGNTTGTCPECGHIA